MHVGSVSSIFKSAAEYDAVGHYPKERGDGWMGTEQGEFFSDEGDGGELGINVLDTSPLWKRGLVVEGIEIRLKDVDYR